jgi:hypothetical protein
MQSESIMQAGIAAFQGLFDSELDTVPPVYINSNTMLLTVGSVALAPQVRSADLEARDSSGSERENALLKAMYLRSKFISIMGTIRSCGAQ